MEPIKTKSYDPFGFRVFEFIDYIEYRGTMKPAAVHKDRWAAMLSWFATRYKYEDWIDEDEN